jgi:hypothetical protein
MGAFKVAGVDGGTGAFEADGRKYTSNSGALIFGPHTPGAVRAGDVALGYDSLLEKTYLGRVTKPRRRQDHDSYRVGLNARSDQHAFVLWSPAVSGGAPGEEKRARAR